MRSWTGPVSRRPWRHRNRSPVPAGRPLLAVPAATSSHGSRDRDRVRVRGRPSRGGAAGSRTRVPRPRCSGLYVRRSRMISDHGAPRPDSSVVLAALKCSPQPGGMGLGVEPRHVDSVLLRGVRGESLAVFMPRESTGRFRQLWFPTHFVEVTSASSARSPGSGMATVEAVSAPGLVVRIDALQFSRMLSAPSAMPIGE